MKNIFKRVLCSVTVAFSCIFAAKVAEAQTVYMGMQIDEGHGMEHLAAGRYIGVCLPYNNFRALAQIIQVVGHHLLVQYDDTRLYVPRVGVDGSIFRAPTQL